MLEVFQGEKGEGGVLLSYMFNPHGRINHRSKGNKALPGITHSFEEKLGEKSTQHNNVKGSEGRPGVSPQDFRKKSTEGGRTDKSPASKGSLKSQPVTDRARTWYDMKTNFTRMGG